MCIAGHGAPVVCLDNDQVALDFIESMTRRRRVSARGRVKTRCIDLEHDPWPYGHDSLGAIIRVHYLPVRLLSAFAESLKAGGYLFLETVGGQGGNYAQLSGAGYVKAVLGDAFSYKYFKEHRVGPTASRAATTKMLAVKA
jgi:hypothetical protein